jgi:predicted transcriptional regulator
MSQKEIALKAVSSLPNDCTFEQIIERLRFLTGIQEGFNQLDRGEGIPHEEVEKMMASWLSD